MNQKELKELIEFLIEKDIAEFELERGDVKVKIKRALEPAPAPESRYFAVHPAPPPTGTTSIVGTFYEAPSPGAPPFIKVGDHVEVGQVLCIVEAMKLMNEIECDVAGEIVKKLVTNGQPIEYGQELFVIRPKK